MRWVPGDGIGLMYQPNRYGLCATDSPHTNGLQTEIQCVVMMRCLCGSLIAIVNG
ncbi:hypothetical protein XACM_1136 [Xanthomonas euvesicatoria pv. citrumelo F1]|nr:hypothetical protein XACM_1136 [Xanthomonas euvesicatoria pv. citrumelo F1]